MMKRGYLLALFVFAISFTLATPQITMEASHSFGETVLGVVEMGEGTELLSDDLNFVFKKGRRSASLTYDVLAYENNYYFYIYPSTLGGYSLSINGILYKEGNSTQAIDLQKNFSVVSGGSNILSVKPGFIYTTDKENLTITNKGNSTLDVNSPAGDFSLASLESRTVLVDPVYEISFFEVNSYKSFKIPVVYYGGSSVKNNTDTAGDSDSGSGDRLILKKEISTTPKNISIVFNSLDSITKTITIENTGDIDIDGIYVESDYNFSMNNFSLGAGESKDFEIEFFMNDSNSEIIAGFGATEIKIPVKISFNESVIDADETCADMGGEFCLRSLNLTCEGESRYASDTLENGANCCLGRCVKIKDSSGSGGAGKVIGVLIFLCLVAGGFFLYKKYKAVGKVGSNKRIREENKAKEANRNNGVNN